MLDTYRRVESLDAMVVLSPGVFVQYQKIQAKQMWSEIWPESKSAETEVHGEEFFMLFKTYHLIMRMKTQGFWILGTILRFMRSAT
jgi:hypothetical protein